MSGRTHLQTLKHQPRTEAVQSAGGSHPLSAQSASVALHLRGGEHTLAFAEAVDMPFLQRSSEGPSSGRELTVWSSPNS